MGQGNMRNFKHVVIMASALGLATNALAADFQVRYRYKDVIWNNDGTVVGPETPKPPEEPKPFVCPDPAGVYSAGTWSITPHGCLYDEPLVDTDTDPDLPVIYDPPTLDEWCDGVFPGSHATQVVESVQQKKAAQHTGIWTSVPGASNVKAIVCTDDPDEPHVDDKPDIRTGTLKNADMESTSGYSSLSNWGGNLIRGVETDRQIGGNRAFTSWDGQQEQRQSVSVSSALTTSGFPVEVKWLQTATRQGNERALVRLEFLDASNQVIGRVVGTFSAPPRKSVVIEREMRGSAPAGTAFVAVVMEIETSGAGIDNVALKIDGVDVSEINGGFGMPVRPQDYVRNAGAESGSADWKAVDSPLYTLAATYLDDPHKLQGAKSFNTSPYGDQTHFQQVWISKSEKGKPITVQWQQGTTRTGAFPTMVSVKFFARSGEALGSMKGEEVPGIPGFWQNRRLTGSVPSNADFMLVEMYFKTTSQWVDNIGINIGGREFAQVNPGKPTSMNLCPSYVNTVNGPADNPWWFDGSLEKRSVVRLDPQADGWKGEQYKSYCVAPGGRYLLGNYTLQAYRAWGGFMYEAFDGTGRKIGEQTLLHDTDKWETPEEIWELYALPSGTSFVKTTLVDLAKAYTNGMGDDYGANFTRRVWATNVNFIMNGSLPQPPQQRTELRNRGAEAGTVNWSPTPRTGGVLTRFNKKALGSITSSSSGSSGTTSTSTVSCDETCGPPIPKDYAFSSSVAAGEFYQDVLVSGYGFAAGSQVKLKYELGITPNVSSTTTVTKGSDGKTTESISTSFDIPRYSAGMALEFYDSNDNLLDSRSSELGFSPFVFWGIDLQRQFSASLPADTWKIRVIMKGLKSAGAAIDDIRLEVAGKNISRED